MRGRSLGESLKIQYAFRITLVYIVFNILQAPAAYFFVPEAMFLNFLAFYGLTLTVPFLMKITRSVTLGAGVFTLLQLTFALYLQINLSCGYTLPSSLLGIVSIFIYVFYVLGTRVGLALMFAVAVLNIGTHFLREADILADICDRTSVLFTEAEIAPFLLIPNFALLAIIIASFLRSNRLIQEDSDKTARQLSAILDGGLQHIAVLNRDAIVLMTDRKSEAIARRLRKKQTILGQKITDYLVPAQRDYFKELLARAFRGESIRTEVRLFFNNNSYSWVDVSFRPVFNDRNQVEYVVMASIETTERREAEERLKRNQNHLRAIIDNTSHLIVSVDRNYRILEVNDKLRQLIKKHQSKEMFPGDSIIDFLSEDVAGPIKQKLEEALHGKHASHIIHIEREDGFNRDFEISYNPIYDENRQIIGVAIFGEDVTRREEYQSSLIAARKAAEDANKAKSEFLANMSHEIRTPLNAIIGMTDLLMETPLSEEQRKFVGIAQRAGRNLADLVNDLLDLSRIEAGKMELEENTCDIRDLISRTLEIVEANAMLKNLKLITEVDADVPRFVVLDNKRLRQILLNLVGNAVKFTPKGVVTVHCKVASSEGSKAPNLVIKVIDTGIGITEEQKKRLFTRFSQGDSSHTKQFAGAGLGLAICERLVTLMGGTISVESEPGKGSVFTVELPFREPLRPEDLITSPQANKTPLAQTVPMTILIAEDNEDNMVLLETFLQPLGHRIVKAVNGQQAVDLYKKNEIDLILMDMQMPVKDGFSATREIRQWERETAHKHTPIAALTAYAMQKEIDLVKESGCDAYLAKPYKKQDLYQLIHQLLDVAS